MPIRGGDELSVLYVDDDPDLRSLVATFLERRDDRLSVATATSAGAALDRLTADVDCIVSDYELPDTDGIEFLEAVRGEYPDLPFILFTAGGSEAVASDAISAGVTDYLRKGTGTEQYAALADRIVDAVEASRTRRQRRRHHTAIETAQEGISIVGADGRFQYVNDAYAGLYGYDPEELLGEHWELLYPDSEVEFVRSELVPAVEAEGYWHGRTTGRRADGTTFLEDHVVSTTENSELICTVRDVSDREARERKLTRLHAATRDLIEATTVEEIATLATDAADDILEFPLNGIHRYDEAVDGLVPISVSNSSRELLGEPPVLTDGLAWETFQRGEAKVYGDVREAEGVLNPDTPIRSEILLPLDEHGVFIASSTECDAFDDADVTFAKLLAANVTSALDRTAHARKLELLQERTQTLMNTSSVDATADVAVTAAREILGADLSTFHGFVERDGQQRLEPVATTDTVHEVFDSTPEYVRSETADPVTASVWEVFDDGEPAYVHDTNEYPEFVDETPARSAILHPIADYGVFVVTSTTPRAFSQTDAKLTDILASTLTTALERVDRESLLRDRTAELEAQNERLERFASIVSHDLRNPLQVAEGSLELAREIANDDDGYDGDNTADDHLDDARWALERMNGLIEELLTLARDGERIDDPEPVDLAALSETCWRSVATAEATLVTRVDRRIRADRSRLEQLLENLFRNAVEHGGDGVTVTVGDLEDEAGFYVEDDGPGIPDDDRARIFESGYSTSADGTGFGLSIVHEIVAAHDWEIAVTEGTGGGTRFEITGLTAAE
ncbi:ATP-binding protein [Halopiger xanaduensis]|uniref:histidine kinase n=1 Tax=Halopiger xanaduensis (strain DSM 18323 / JCM 14033 / SH-6) TaxID=797210 RepID=F8D3T2_HALXS|nr:GAF domain-containing protein [Halopiger xanaduensis]AEH38585.1 multi-sensor signal transduction histidine kinase [Halopiger xanaduensis SH-6]